MSPSLCRLSRNFWNISALKMSPTVCVRERDRGRESGGEREYSVDHYRSASGKKCCNKINNG